jgi:hypothetical protein
MGPLSQAAASLVEVCADGPLLLHRTVVPRATVLLEGEKL